MNEAFLMIGLQTCGKTTLAKQLVEHNGGAMVSAEDFFYKIVGSDQPNVYSFDPQREVSCERWTILEIKKLCDAGVSPLFIDRINSVDPYTTTIAGMLARHYGYHVQTIETEHPLWEAMYPELVKPPKERDRDLLLGIAEQVVEQSDKGTPLKKVVWWMENWEEFTPDELLEHYRV